MFTNKVNTSSGKSWTDSYHEKITLKKHVQNNEQGRFTKFKLYILIFYAKGNTYYRNVFQISAINTDLVVSEVILPKEAEISRPNRTGSSYFITRAGAEGGRTRGALVEGQSVNH